VLRRSERWIIFFAALALAAATARLGWWQLDRAAQKRGLQQALDSRRNLPPLDASGLARSAAQLEGQLHRPVRLSGRWADRHTVALDNRALGGRAGFIVLTPLLLADGDAVVVQRGWLPRDPSERTKFTLPAVPAGEVAVHGRIAAAPSRLYEFESAASGVLRQNLVLADFARETGLKLLPLTILQSAAADDASDVLQRNWPAPAVDLHKHHGYALQWFGLSLLTVILYLWFQIISPRLRRSGHEQRA
jgi:surfeit locus 1 family protein